MAFVSHIFWLVRWASSLYVFWLSLRLFISGHVGGLTIAAIAFCLWLNPYAYHYLERLLIKVLGNQTVFRIAYLFAALFGLIILLQANDQTVAHSTFDKIFYGIGGISYVAFGLQATLETFGKTMLPRKIPKYRR
jgi:hypothetical protein